MEAERGREGVSSKKARGMGQSLTGQETIVKTRLDSRVPGGLSTVTVWLFK